VVHVELAARAAKELRKIRSDRARRDVTRCLKDELTGEPHPENMDLKPLTGHAPWMRARCGEHRVLFRPLTADELKKLDVEETAGYLVARIIDRADLERAIRTL
jgi:mRNA-degrading endonuclease RelE of RelBE toxin-antitoxin system